VSQIAGVAPRAVVRDRLDRVGDPMSGAPFDDRTIERMGERDG